MKRLALSALILATLDAQSTIIIVQDIEFGKTVPRASTCTIHPVTGVLTSPDDTCFSPYQNGQYRISGNPHTTYEIKLVTGTYPAHGLTFTPTGRFVNNQGDDQTNFIADTFINFDTGSDGIINIYVGGTLQFDYALPHSWSFSQTMWSIEYNEL